MGVSHVYTLILMLVLYVYHLLYHLLNIFLYIHLSFLGFTLIGNFILGEKSASLATNRWQLSNKYKKNKSYYQILARSWGLPKVLGLGSALWLKGRLANARKGLKT